MQYKKRAGTSEQDKTDGTETEKLYWSGIWVSAEDGWDGIRQMLRKEAVLDLMSDGLMKIKWLKARIST